MNWLFFVQVCVETISLCTCPHLRIRRSHTYEYTYKHKRAICTFQIANTLHFTLYTFDLFTINYILYDIYYLILLNFYIYHNFRKNTRGVTEVTEVTRDSEGWLHEIRDRGARHPGQPIAMSKKSSNFALAIGWRTNQMRFSRAPRKMHR